jgi:glycosyltransferase involved in cell wall biosynthesis
MRIVYLWDSEYPWDVRTEKVCAALTAAGHEVHVVARNRTRLAPVEELPEATVHRMTPWPVGASADAALSFPAFFNPRWVMHLNGVMRRVRPSVLIARDLPLCPTALAAGRRHRVPVVFDMAENYPAMLRELWDEGRQRTLDMLVRNPRAAAAVERACLPRVSRTLVVVRESGERLERLGVPSDRIAVVSNTPPRERAWRAETRPLPAGGPLRLVYLGLMEAHRGVGEMIEAAALLNNRRKPVHLRLVGEGRDLARFRNLAEALSLPGSMVEFTGRLPHAQALRAVAGADVGVVPHHADEAWNTTVPNKLFDYMAAGLPVLSSDAAPPARILAATGAGVVFRSGDARSLADALQPLRDPIVRRRMGEAGRRAVLRTYNWENDSAVLLQAVESAAAEAATLPIGRGFGLRSTSSADTHLQAVSEDAEDTGDADQAGEVDASRASTGISVVADAEADSGDAVAGAIPRMAKATPPAAPTSTNARK